LHGKEQNFGCISITHTSRESALEDSYQLERKGNVNNDKRNFRELRKGKEVLKFSCICKTSAQVYLMRMSTESAITAAEIGSRCKKSRMLLE